MALFKLSFVLTLCALIGCAPSSYIGNIPSGAGGKAMSQYGDTPPTSFAYSLNDGYYFISTNEYSDIVTITIRLSKKSDVRLISGNAQLGNSIDKTQSVHFPALEYQGPINPDCGFTKFIGCNNYYTYQTFFKLETLQGVKMPKNKGEKLIVIAPEVVIDGKVFSPELVTFIRGKGTYLSPLNS